MPIPATVASCPAQAKGVACVIAIQLTSFAISIGALDLAAPLGVVEDAQEMRRAADHLIARKAHIDRVKAPADNVAALMQPTTQQRDFGPVGDPFHRAEQGNRGAIDIAPPRLSGWWCVSGHPRIPPRGWLMPAGRQEPSAGGRGLDRRPAGDRVPGWARWR